MTGSSDGDRAATLRSGGARLPDPGLGAPCSDHVALDFPKRRTREPLQWPLREREDLTPAAVASGTIGSLRDLSWREPAQTAEGRFPANPGPVSAGSGRPGPPGRCFSPHKHSQVSH